MSTTISDKIKELIVQLDEEQEKVQAKIDDEESNDDPDEDDLDKLRDLDGIYEEAIDVLNKLMENL